MYFMSGAKLRYISAVVVGGIAIIATVVAITPYRATRILTYLNPEADAQGTGYHVLQSKIAIGAGGLTGVGYGQSVMKYRLPETIGDSIFAVSGEEFGFIGSTLILLMFLGLIMRMLFISTRIHDPFGRLLLIGFACVIGLQVFTNVGAMTGILPLTGTPLPFMSYGGTSLAVFLTMIGISVNISKYARR
jgi:cell division protein FtsW